MVEQPHYERLETSGGQRRRLRVLATLLLATARCGCKATPYGSQDAERVQVTVGHQIVLIGLKAFEVTRRSGTGAARKTAVKHHRRCEMGPRDDGRPSERLWEDGEHPLEHRLREIATEVIVAGEQQYRNGCLRTFRWRVERKAQLAEEIRQRRTEAERRERERQAALERKRVERLLGAAASLQRAREIRRYVDEVCRLNAAMVDPLPAGPIRNSRTPSDATCSPCSATAEILAPIRLPGTPPTSPRLRRCAGSTPNTSTSTSWKQRWWT
jgi:hypothetical protein